MVILNSLLLILACRSRYAIAEASLNESDGAAATINIATVISAHGFREQAYPSSSLAQDGDSADFVLVGNTSTAEKWFGTAAGYAAAADSRVIFEVARWTLLEDGARHEKLSTFWARFHGVNSTTSSSQTICTVVVEWEGGSWTDDEAVLAAVEIEDRLKVNCGENDTIALAFTSAITDAVDAYPEVSATRCYAHEDSSSCSGSGHGPPALSIGTVVSISDSQDQHNSTYSSFDHEDSIDLVLVANTSNSSTGIDGVAGYTTAAESRVLYQAASWSLLEEGTQSGKFSSYWARFQSVNPTIKSSVHLSVCTMVVQWNSSRSDSKSALSAVEVENRLTAKCGENDTIAVAFTSTVSKTAANFLEGEVTVNGVVASLKMHDVDSSAVSEASHRMFVRLANGFCPRDGSAQAFSSLNVTEAPVISLMRGEACWPGPGSHLGPPQTLNQGNSYESDWKHNLRFIIPVVVCILLLGCAGFIFIRRQKKGKASQTIEAPKEDNPEEEKGEKDDASSQPYVLTTQPVV
ncbi:hypothetical protein PF001_g12792 [Phytophthora fragariae]|uniref:Uncharacterized protein n=1 Tax=Phytophthora fragariae TaxID=53985 RepID=A0A6A4DNH1_9STRA|nr:hypothetical protein PF001_g12792 [Phytophthora fragariae]